MGFIRSLFYALATTPAYYVISILFGAPLLSNFDDTLAFSLALSIFASWPILYSTSCNFDQTCSLVLDSSFLSKSQYFARYSAVGSILGAWFGAIVIPLDWDRWWQKWPLPCLFGIVIGCFIGLCTAQIQLYFGWGKAAKLKRHFKIV